MTTTGAPAALAGRVVLVTGASSGIGAAVSELAARCGARVLLVGRDEDHLAAVARRCAGTVVPADLSRSGAPEQLASRALALAGRVDVVVHCAGLGWAGRFATMPTDWLDRLVSTNLLAPLALTRALLPAMLAAGEGHVVFVSSIAGAVGVRDEAVYSASKAALDVFADALRLELSGQPVGVSVVVPGAVRTSFFDRRGHPYDRAFPRLQPPERVARAVLGAVLQNRALVYVPRWLLIPARLHGVAPGIYHRLSRRFG